MKPTKIALFGIRPEEQIYLVNLFKDLPSLTVSYDPTIIGPDSIPANNDAEILSVFVSSEVNAAVLDAFPNLKYITVRSTGYDNIDLAEATKRGITVSNVPSYGENTVAEFAFGLILTLSRKIYAAADQVKENGNFSTANLRGFDLMGKTIGILGTGRIGRHAIKIAKGFGMNVIGYDPYPNEKSADELGFKYVSLDELLSQSDVISLHVPYSKETHHIIDAVAFSKMKKTSILINTSRGGIVDTGALVNALKSQQIAGAGIDVLEEENAIKDESLLITQNAKEEHDLRTVLADDVLMKMPNVIVTPHVAFNTDEALQRILDTTVENVKSWVEGKVVNQVK